MQREEVFQRIRAVGRAALTAGLENSHSGNISMKLRDPSGEELLAITATGAQKGELTPDKICYPTIHRTNFGYYKASSETDIHARILSLPGVGASIHGHTRIATIVTLDDEAMPKKNPRRPLLPIDPLGVRFLYSVPVDWFAVASGSKDMTESISKRLEENPACIIQTHGAFVRGASLEEALFHLAIVEHSGEVIHLSELLGVDIEAARNKAENLKPWFIESIPDYSTGLDQRIDFGNEPETAEMFLTQGFRVFESRYSPFHTGSMSIRGSRSILFVPKAAMPHELHGPMLDVPLESSGMASSGNEFSSPELEIHRAIYARTPLKSVVHCYVSEAQAAALMALEKGNLERAKIIPIDVEGGFLYPSVPVLPPRPDIEELCRALLDYRMAIVAFGGVWSAGEQSVGEAIRHVSSIRDICYYRIMAKMRGLDASRMEPTRARNW
jgi:methylthioribulose-1-phosphate dehydratase